MKTQIQSNTKLVSYSLRHFYRAPSFPIQQSSKIQFFNLKKGTGKEDIF